MRDIVGADHAHDIDCRSEDHTRELGDGSRACLPLDSVKGRGESPALSFLCTTNLLLLIPVVIGLVMLLRRIQRRPIFTKRD